jgi:RNA polymerase sigma factor (sigma-70 family)
LVAAVRAGDDHAFEELYHRYQRRIGAYIYGMVHDHGRAEDITQDVFMSALRRMRATETPIAFKPWVYEIAKNACIDAFRRSRRAEEISYDADGSDRLHLVSKGPTPEAAVDTRMSLDHLRGAFGGLSEAHHQILVMRELEGLSYRQIGERLGMSRPSVESTLFRARPRLSEEYEELVSGERCRRIQAIITGASDGRVGARDERKMARHVSYCQPCRRAAFAAGFDADALTPKRTVREKIAALLPLPAFLKRRIAGHRAAADESAAGSVGGHAATLAQLSTAAATYADPAMHWGKAVAKAAAVAAAVVGAGVAAHDTGLIGPTPRDERPAAISSPATSSRDASGSLTTRPAANGTSTGGAGTSSSSSPSSGGPSSGSASNSGSGSSSGSQSPSTPLGDDPVNAAASKLPSGTGDTPLTKTVKHLTNPGSREVPVKTPEVPKVEVPKVELPKLPDPPASVPDPGGVVSGATGAVNDATGAATGAVNGATGAVNGATGTVTGAVNGATGTVTGAVSGATGTVTGTVGGVTGGGGLPGGG